MAGNNYMSAMDRLLAEVRSGGQPKPAQQQSTSRTQSSGRPNTGNDDSAISSLQKRLAEIDKKIAWEDKQRKKSAVYRVTGAIGDALPIIDSFREGLQDERASILENIQDIQSSRAQIERSGGYGKGGLGAAFKRGLGNEQATRGALGAMIGDVEEEDIDNIIQGRNKTLRAARNKEEQDAYERFQSADGFIASAREVFTNPRLLANIAIESVPSSVYSMGGAIVGGAIGAAAGAPAGPAGPVIGARVGGSLGSGLGSFATEYGNAMLETFENNGVDIDDPEELKAAINDPAIMEEARERGVRRGIAVGAFDALSVGLAGKLGGGQIARKIAGEGASTGRKAAAVGAGGAVETFSQGALGAAGEASGQLAADGEITSPQDIVAEFAGEIPTGFVEASVGAGAELANRGGQPNQSAMEDEELAAALAARGQDNPTQTFGGYLEDGNANALREMGNVPARGMNFTPDQVLEFARNNEQNPRIADIMSQPVSDVTKVEQVARIMNEEEAARVEPEAIRRISGMIGGTTPVSKSRQMISDELAKISPEIIAQSKPLSAIAEAVQAETGGKQFVNGLRSIVNNYQPATPAGQTFVARPERGGDGSVIMTQDQVTDEAQREREAQQAFRMAGVRQARFDTATGQGTQREDLRAGAPEPQAQFFLNPEFYGDELGGTVATIVGAEGGRVRIQYESPNETDANGAPVIISEDVDPASMFDRVVRGTARMTQELAGNLRRPKAGTGTDLNPRRSVDRTSTRAIVPTNSGVPEKVSPTRFTGFAPNEQEIPAEQEVQNAQVNPVIEGPANVEGIAEGPNEISGTPAAPQLPAPEVQEAPAQAPATEEAPAAEEPAPKKKPAPTKKERVEKHIDNIDDKVTNLDRAGIVRYADKVRKEGLIDDADHAEIKRMAKDKDMGPEDIGPELISMLEINAERDSDGDVNYSGRTDKVREPRRKASDVVNETPTTREREKPAEPEAPKIDYDAVIKDRLDKIAERGGQGRVVASRLRSLLKQSNYTPRQLYYAFQMGEVVSRVLPQSSKVDILFVPSMQASDPRAAAASGIDLGEEASGSYQAYQISQNGFRGLITLSLSDSVLSVARENAAHEAFHVIQDMMRVYDPSLFEGISKAFRNGMTIKELDPSILRVLKTRRTDAEVSVYDTLIEDFGDTPLSNYEAQAVAFGALLDAKDRGVPMKGLKASFIRFVDMLEKMIAGFRDIFRSGGKTVTIAEVFDDFRTGKAQEGFDVPAPLADEETRVQYSARRYNPDKGLDSAIENLKEDIVDVGGEVIDATTIDELVSSDQIPVITLKDLVGKKIFPTISDRTAAAALYTGIDSSTTVAVPMLGGPNYPFRKSSVRDGLGWANRGGSVLTAKMNKVKAGANYMMVVLGDADMHDSNTTLSNAYFVTLEAYVRDGRISEENRSKLADMIRNAQDADPAVKKHLSNFPSFDSVEVLDKYIHSISFDARARMMNIMSSKAALNLGAPSLRRVVEATREASMAGHRWGDGVLVVELQEDGAVTLGENGTMKHPDFPLGLRGKVVGRLEYPISWELIWQDFIKESNKRTESRGKKANMQTARFDFQRSMPIVEITQELVDRIGPINYPNIDSARQARLASDFAAGNWKTSDISKNSGGIAPVDFVDAIKNSAAQVVLNEYELGQVNKDVKAGKMRLFQLGNDGQIFFALKKGDPQYAEDYGVEIPMVGKDEVMVTAVINNEQGARGIAGPAVMLKAIEEGATVLDCFAVKSKKYPNGFLPELYEQFGFMKVAEIPFDPQYYSDTKLADAVKYWKDSSSGYDPKTDGYPPLVIMKWIGNDEQRQGILERYLAGGIEGLLEGGTRADVADFEAEFRGGDSQPAGQGGSASVSQRAAGAEGTRAGSSLTSRARAVVEAVAQLSDQQLTNLGLTKRDRENAQRKVAAAPVQYSGRRAVYTKERIDQTIRDMAYSMDDDKSKGWLTFMSPDQFLGLTLSKDGRDRLATMDPTKTRARPLNIDELAKETQPIFLEVQEAPEPSAVQRSMGVDFLPWRVMGHEGRHRMTALKAAGIDQVPVILRRQQGATQLETLSNITLAPQRAGRSDQYSNGDTQTVISEAVPINYRNVTRVREMMEGGDIRFSGRRGGGSSSGPQALKPAYSFRDTDYNFGGEAPNKLDEIIYNLQDKLVDVKRIQKNIKDAGGRIGEDADVYRAEELFHGRAAKRAKDFVQRELNPLLEEMKSKGVSLEQLDRFLHARHAKERNAQIRKINPDLQDRGSGLSDREADGYLASLPKARRQQLEKLAGRVDAIIQNTQKMMVQYGLETQQTIDTWNQTYKSYVPLQREGFEDDGVGAGGQGMSVRGSSTRRALGSELGVVDILANIAMQRERVISRGERNRVGNALTVLALQNPNDSFWFVIDPKGSDAAKSKQKLIDFGMDPADAENVMGAPMMRYMDQNTGRLVERPNSLFMNQPFVMATRINGEDKFIVFNSRNPRSQRMVTALKNIDAFQMGAFVSGLAKVTRYFASINTQYNPAFGLYNLIRDLGGATINLSSTPIAGKQRQVLANALPAAFGMYRDLRTERRGGTASTNWAQLAEEFELEGGKTGYRDLFATSTDRAEAIENELTGGSKARRVAMAVGGPVFNWLSDFNEAIENGVRLSAYKAAKDAGLSKAQAASIAKNLTVNFNRKGVVGAQAGAFYAFFNASVQGTARLAETLKGPAGKKIIMGGVLLGFAQAIALSAAGIDDEIPDWLKDKNLVIPLGGKKYFAFPMPLGLHAIPSMSRRAVEFFMAGGEDAPERIIGLMGMMADAFNPIGNAGLSLQTISPTVIDPWAALAENKDFAGRSIAINDFNTLDPTAGYERNKEGVSVVGDYVSRAIDYITGGNGYTAGALSPTGDQVDYLIGQFTGGVGRLALNTMATAKSVVTGEDLPNYKIPVVGRMIGDANEAAAISGRFYDAIKEMNGHKRTIEGMEERGKDTTSYFERYPEAELYDVADQYESDLRKLKKEKKLLKEEGASQEEIDYITEEMQMLMVEFNQQIEDYKRQ